MEWTALDLFCGAGGLSQGLIRAGFKVVAAVDSWDTAIKSYSANFLDHPAVVDDVGLLSEKLLREIGVRATPHLVVGGPPCQGFSIQRIGEDFDERNDLVLAFSRLVRNLNPPMFMMENVPGLLGARGRAVFRQFIGAMNKAGYETTHSVLDAVDFGLPQHRRRVFVVGWRPGVGPFHFPASTQIHYRTVREAIEDLPEPPADYSPSSSDQLHRRSRLSVKNQERLRHVPPGGGFEDLPLELRVNCHREGAARIGHRAVYGRLDPDKPAGTITARFDSFTRGRFAHPWSDRNITLREGARLQGFSDDHVFLGTQEEIAAQIGNAVPPPLAEALARAILNALSGTGRPIQGQFQHTLPLAAVGLGK